MRLGWLLAFLFGFGWLPVFVFRAEAVRQALHAYGFAERFAVWLSISAFAVHMTAACTVLTMTPAVPLLRGILGVAVFAAGIAFWLWGRVLIGPLRTRRLPDEPPLRLRRDGAFGIVRHPLYFGSLVAAGAPVLSAGCWWLAATFAFCAGALAIRAVQEERRLRAQLGREYDDYSRRVRRLIPFVW